jgi:hypothetical protein
LFILRNGDSATDAVVGVLSGDQMPLNEKLPFMTRGLLEIDPDHPFAGRYVHQEMTCRFHDMLALVLAGAIHEWKPIQIACDANT